MEQNLETNLEFKDFDIEEAKKDMELRLKGSNEVLALANQIDMRDANSVLKFGDATATEISSFADKILNNIKTTNLEDSGTLLMQLNKIMDKFDVKDFEDKKPGFLEKLMNSAKKSVDALLKKYETMGGEVDKVYQELKKYESEISVSNNMLEDMFAKNMEYYQMLEQHIFAAETVLKRFNEEAIPQLKEKAESTGNQLDQVNLNNAYQMIEMLEQRIFDLELAKNVALQTMPQIKLIQKGNYNLVRKINSAFIVTIPIFKQSLTQAITIKRQAIQAKALSALDEKTNELLLRNAQNTALQSKLTAQLASGSSISVETLEQTWRTIVQGIEETKQIQDEAKTKRIEGTKKLYEIQKDFQERSRKG